MLLAVDVLCPLGSAGNAPGTSPGPLSGLIPDTRQGNLAAVLHVYSYRLDQVSLFHRVSFFSELGLAIGEGICLSLPTPYLPYPPRR